MKQYIRLSAIVNADAVFQVSNKQNERFILTQSDW